MHKTSFASRGFNLALVYRCSLWILALTSARFALAAEPATPAKQTNAADEKAIRATADDFVKAFNAGDAHAIGTQWSLDAEYNDEAGREFQGRAAIEKLYADLFREHPGATIEVKIDSIRFLGPDIAIEKGITTASLPKEGAVSSARYTVTHARREGKWLMVVGRDSPYIPDSKESRLKDIQWMVGRWRPDGKVGLEIDSESLSQGNFIKNNYKITVDGKSTPGGSQIIGWDPRLGKIVAWNFDAEGGFGHSVWTKDHKKWVLEAHGTSRDGSESSAINIIAPIDADSFTFQSVHRKLDGVSLPDIGPVKIVRIAASK